MAAPVPDHREPSTHAPTLPVDAAHAVRAELPADLVAVFDDEWQFVLDEAKQTFDLTSVRELLTTWRAFAAQERRRPGSYRDTLARAAEIQRTGHARPGALDKAAVDALIAARLHEAEGR